jgi:endonuclease/exonuclease/phosphatase family metal-dependent hydrolase
MQRFKLWLPRLTVWACYAYLVLLFGCVFALRGVGERYWMTGVAMYVPRLLLGLPCAVLVPLLFGLGLPRLLWTQLLAAAIVLFPLMGLQLPHLPAAASGPSVRVLSYNVAHCEWGQRKLSERILQYAPDIVLLQEICPNPTRLLEHLRARLPVQHVSDQFVLASRYPLRTSRDMGRFDYAGRSEAERFVRYELETPLGPIAFYNVHPVSVRWAFYAVWSMGVRSSLRAGTFLRGGKAEEPMHVNFELRRLQLAAAAEMAATEHIPRVVAGDTNITGGSPVFARYFGGYRDGFHSADWGFGYTFPSVRPWMRLDRILASPELRFTRFRVGCGDASDHLCVIAQLER